VAVTILSSPGVNEMAQRTFFCMIENLSVCGLKLKTDVRLERNARLELRVAFSQPLKAFKRRGRVAWVKVPGDQGKGCEIGIEFDPMDPADFVQWKNLIRERIHGMKA
jgi:hypothetical protein